MYYISIIMRRLAPTYSNPPKAIQILNLLVIQIAEIGSTDYDTKKRLTEIELVERRRRALQNSRFVLLPVDL